MGSMLVKTFRLPPYQDWMLSIRFIIANGGAIARCFSVFVGIMAYWVPWPWSSWRSEWWWDPCLRIPFGPRVWQPLGPWSKVRTISGTFRSKSTWHVMLSQPMERLWTNCGLPMGEFDGFLLKMQVLDDTVTELVPPVSGRVMLGYEMQFDKS